MAKPIQQPFVNAAGSLSLLLAALGKRRPRRDDRIHFDTAIQANITTTGSGLAVRFDQPDPDTAVRHTCCIQSSRSVLQRLAGQMQLSHRTVERASFSLGLMSRHDERVRLAAECVDSSVISVGRAMMIAVEYEGWVDRACQGLAFSHCGAMSGRLVLTGGRDSAEWSLAFTGDFVARPQVQPALAWPNACSRPTTAA